MGDKTEPKDIMVTQVLSAAAAQQAERSNLKEEVPSQCSAVEITARVAIKHFREEERDLGERHL